MLFLYLAILIPALYWVSKILLPEMVKPPLQQTASGSGSIDFSQSDEADTDKRMKKLETLLSEKNRSIDFLDNELKVFHAQISAFDKIRTLLEEEIHHLRAQNRMFRSELGLPTTQPKVNSIT